MNYFPKIILIFITLAQMFLVSGQSHENTDSIRTAMLQPSLPYERIRILLNMTDSLSTRNPEEGLIYAMQALSLAEEQNYEQGKLVSMRQIADIYWGKTDLEAALNYANQAKNLAMKIDNKKEYAEVNLIIGKVYTDLGEYEKSSELNFEALKIFEMEKDKAGEGKALSRIGSIYYEQEKYDKALEYYLNSLSIAREINDQVGISRGLNNVAVVYADKKEFRNFEKNINEAININIKNGRRLWEGINYLNLGVAYNIYHNLDSAYFYIQQSISIFTELNNIPRLLVAYVILSNYYSEINDSEKSLYYANKSFQMGKTDQLKTAVHIAARRLREIYFEQGNLEKAYKYISIEYQMKDSLDIEKSITRLSQLELIYQFEKETQEKKIKQQRKDYIYGLIITVIIFLFVIIIVLLLTRQRIRRKNAIIQNKQFKSEIEIKNKELTFHVMILMRKNETLLEIADKLMEIRDEAVKDETKTAIKKIARELNRNIDNKIWEEFEIRFKQLHHTFYKNLIQSFPTLSPQEQRLCAFLRLNMTTKEIAELNGQQINTIEVARFRLRKKLGIGNTKTNLVTFLSEF